MNKKQTIKLNESQLRRIVSESVKNVLMEEFNTPNCQMDQYLEYLRDMGHISQRMYELIKLTIKQGGEITLNEFIESAASSHYLVN